MVEYRKKLIEVALPLVAINKEAAREKLIRHGHLSHIPHLKTVKKEQFKCMLNQADNTL